MSSLRAVIADFDRPTGSRVGGARPATLADERCPVCGSELGYVLTLTNELLGDQIVDGEAISLLHCLDHGCLVAARKAVDPSPIVVVRHEDAAREVGVETGWEPRSLVRDSSAEPVVCDETFVGGVPEFLQSRGPGQALRCEELGCQDFLFQWSESTWRNDMLLDTYPFGFGAVYVFADEARQRFIGFWQNT